MANTFSGDPDFLAMEALHLETPVKYGEIEYFIFSSE